MYLVPSEYNFRFEFIETRFIQWDLCAESFFVQNGWLPIAYSRIQLARMTFRVRHVAPAGAKYAGFFFSSSPPRRRFNFVRSLSNLKRVSVEKGRVSPGARRVFTSQDRRRAASEGEPNGGGGGGGVSLSRALTNERSEIKTVERRRRRQWQSLLLHVFDYTYIHCIIHTTLLGLGTHLLYPSTSGAFLHRAHDPFPSPPRVPGRFNP